MLPEIGENNTEITFSQLDGATAPSTKETIQMPEAISLKRLISRLGDMPCSLRSPNLSALHFFVWGYLKGKAYIGMPDTLKLQQLKQNIIEKSNNILPETLSKVMNSIACHCLTNNGVHINRFLFILRYIILLYTWIYIKLWNSLFHSELTKLCHHFYF